MPRLYAILAAVFVVLLLAVTWFMTRGGQSDDQFAQCRASQIAGGAGAIGGPFELVNADGQTVTDADVITEPALIYFGYTFCPDVCPFDMARNADAVDVLESRGQMVTPVFISIDPERDTPEVVGDYAENLHERLIGLTGSPEQVKAASKAYKTYYKAQDKSDEFYLVDHSTFSYLVLPEHGFVEFFRREIEPEKMADQIGCFLDAA
ncbi:SCO family protein [Ruegeria sp. 2205SS24-7]|uniref:SCO family protein n=1 Tax=Ruegeria discodermiae TaxID=3064389 RepID=UPI002741EDDC|nr:SCO family protein [Ruegeria sp. 2205SS24-7]MDP5219491.1 SCO family protein [Ruegeria sp. 2205SS24-7]